LGEFWRKKKEPLALFSGGAEAGRHIPHIPCDAMGLSPQILVFVVDILIFFAL
jgi:hypothetical protein